MTALYSRDGGPPQPLPVEANGPDNRIFTDLANNPEVLVLLGFALASCPPQISALQGKQQLRLLGLYDGVEASIEGGDDQELKIYWANAVDWHRDHPKLMEMAGALGMDEAAADAFFIAAVQIT